jgi:hypothetical protein
MTTPQPMHLMRTWYQTDADTKEPAYRGTFSDTIPGLILQDGATMVKVDWDTPAKGWVEVTYLMPGPGSTSENPYPWTNPEVKP